MDLLNFDRFMNRAIQLAIKAESMNEVPIGSVIVDNANRVIGEGHNLKETLNDPTAHAEIIALREAAKNISNWRLENCILYTTLEPCPMCLSAMILARVEWLVFAAYDLKGGAISLNYNLYKDLRLNHQLKVMGGFKENESSVLLSIFFKKLRRQ